MTSSDEKGLSCGQFLRNAGKGGILLVSSGGILAAVSSSAFASSATASDITTLPAAYTAESLAVVVNCAILKNFHAFKHPKLDNRDYFEAALRNEKDHKAVLSEALGANTPTGLTFKIPASVTRTGQALLNTGVALETAFVEACLGASETLSSQDLRTIASKVAANEATHLRFFDAEAGGHGVLPSVPKSDTIPNTVKKLKPFLG